MKPGALGLIATALGVAALAPAFAHHSFAAQIKPGEHMKISGNPERTGEPRIFFTKLVRADGTELVRGGDRLNAIEEDRRLRAAQRAAAPGK